MHYLLTLLSQAAAITAVIYLWLGQQYLATMYGLHPMISGAAALSLLLVPYWLAWSIQHRVTAALDDQDDMIAAYQKKYRLASFAEPVPDKLAIAKQWLWEHRDCYNHNNHKDPD